METTETNINNPKNCYHDNKKTHSKHLLHPVMLAGTGSDVGKSVLATALCRIFKQDGFNPAPFKAQNMALNSFVTPEGLEIGRAQAVQAEAACIPCHTDMNPLLLKPTTDCRSQVVLNGKAVGHQSAYEYFRKEGREYLREQVQQAFDRLAARYNPIVMEGAGSIAEINLQDIDIVNMPMARYAQADVLLVADIDRGGVFASAYGSIMLQRPEDRHRIKGVIINKFRGDIRLFERGKEMMEEICGIPVLGVIPYYENIRIEAEDSVAITKKQQHAIKGKINIAVIKLRQMANFTDFDRLENDERLQVYYTDSVQELSDADIIILPGSKSTAADLATLHANGLAQGIREARRQGKTIIGICGGYQMMGQSVEDPDNIESSIRKIPGLGLLPIATILQGDKITRRVTFHMLTEKNQATSFPCEGYEIHMGRTWFTDLSARPLNQFPNGKTEGCYVDSHCMGTYIHGFLDNRDVIEFILRPFTRQMKGNDTSSVKQAKHCERTDKAINAESYQMEKEQQYDRLADHVRRHLDMERLYNILGSGAEGEKA